MQKSTFVFLAVLLAVANVQATKLRQNNTPSVNCSRVSQDLEYVFQGHLALLHELEQVAPFNFSSLHEHHQLVAIKNLLSNKQEQKGDSCDYYFKFNLGLVYDATCKKYLALEKAYQNDPAKVVAQACSQISFNEPALQHRQLPESGQQKDLACLYAQLLEQTEVFLTTVDEFRQVRCHVDHSFIAEKQQLNCERVQHEAFILEQVISAVQSYIDYFAPLREQQQQQGHKLVSNKKLRTNMNKRLGRNILLSENQENYEEQYEHLCAYYGKFQLGTVFEESCARYRQLEERISQNPSEVLANACNQVSFNDPVLAGRQLPEDLEIRNNVCLGSSVVGLYSVFLDSIKSLASQRCH